MATRLYLHDALFDTTTYSGTYPTNNGGGAAPALQGGLTPNNWEQAGADAASVHRSMNKTKGTSQSSKTISTLASTASNTYYITKFISDPLDGITSLNAVPWSILTAIAENSLSANLICWVVDLYAWRPSTGARVGSMMYAFKNGGTFLEPDAINSIELVKGFVGTSSTNATAVTVADGDVIIFEVYFRTSQADATSRQISGYYDGATEHDATTNGAVVSDVASYIETTQDLTFISDAPQPPIDMTISELKSISDFGMVKV